MILWVSMYLKERGERDGGEGRGKSGWEGEWKDSEGGGRNRRELCVRGDTTKTEQSREEQIW